MKNLIKLRRNPIVSPGFRYFIPIILISSLLLHLCSLDGGHNWGGDFASYLRQAHCIVNGSFEPFMTQNTFTVTESDMQLGPSAYPWGYPLLLAVFLLFSPDNLFLMKLPALFCHFIFLLGLYYLFRDRLRRLDLVILLSVFGFSPVLAVNSNDINSDMAFLGFAYASLLLSRKCLLDTPARKNLYLCFFAGFLIGYTTMVRINGLALFPSLVLALGYLNRRRWSLTIAQSSMVFIGMSIVIGFFLLLFPSGETSHFILLLKNLSLKSLMNHISFYGYSVWTKWFHAGYLLPGIFCALLWAASIPPLIRGIIESFRLNAPETILYVIYSVATLAIYVVWPAMELRFVYPLLPLMMFWILRGIHCFAMSKHLPAFSVCCRVVLFGLIGIGLSLGLFRAARLRFMGNPLKVAAYTAESLQLYEYIRKNTSEGSVILFFKPRVMTLQTGRRSLYIFRPENLDKGDYYCHTDDFQDGSGELLQSCQLEECYRNGPFRLFRIRKETQKKKNPRHKQGS